MIRRHFRSRHCDERHQNHYRDTEAATNKQRHYSCVELSKFSYQQKIPWAIVNSFLRLHVHQRTCWTIMIVSFLFAFSYTLQYLLCPRVQDSISSPITSHIKSWGSDQKPRQVGIYYASDISSLDRHQFSKRWLSLHHQNHNISWAEEGAFDMTMYSNNSSNIKGSKKLTPFEHDNCVRQYEWQVSSFPSCNLFHEVDLTHLHEDVTNVDVAKLIASGYWRDVWYVRDVQRKIVLKTLRFEHNWIQRYFDRNRRDAVAAERLTKSPYVVDIFGFCGNSALGEYGQGDLYNYINRLTDSKSYLRIAYQIASGIADLHNSDKEGVASIVHADLNPSQFILIDGVYKLNDFNLCQFIPRNNITDQSCPLSLEQNTGRYRSPEEFLRLKINEKIDVFSMANIFYYIISKEEPFAKLLSKDAKKMVSKGHRPQLPGYVKNSTDVNIQTLVKAIEMGWSQDPSKRSSAREVQQYLRMKLDEIQ